MNIRISFGNIFENQCILVLIKNEISLPQEKDITIGRADR